MGSYISTMRKLVGHETLFTVGCGIIIEDQQGRILLQKRKDSHTWSLPGGIMELGETFEETAKREVYEETDLEVDHLKLFGLYSGPSCFAEYPNGDKTYSVQIIFISNSYTGELKQDGEESFEHRFFAKDELPTPLNPRQSAFILDWAAGLERPLIK